jgi:hypothetical protein
MKPFRVFLLIALMIMIFSPFAYSSNPENLLGMTLDYGKGEITIHVVSSGCTQKNDFRFEMKGDTLSVIRVRKDDCKVMGSEVRFTYTLKEAGINANKAFIVRNTFIANLFIANISSRKE